MERGEFITCHAPFGYKLVDKKDLEVEPEEAAIVRWIFDSFLKGRSSRWIAEQLTKRGVPSQSGSGPWMKSSIRYLLSNEKYVGDSLCQKYFSSGFPFVQKKNQGERQQYYTENTHPAIIDRETFEKVQDLMQKKAQRTRFDADYSPLRQKVVCGNCGTSFLRRSTKSGYVIWVCRRRNEKAENCAVGRIPEEEIYAAFLRMYHRLKGHSDIPMGLTPAKARKTAERAADAWEQDIRQEYEKQCALTALGKIYQIPAEKRRDDFCAFVNDTWFPLQVRDGKHKSKTVAFYESTQFASLINVIDLGRAFRFPATIKPPSFLLPLSVLKKNR